MTHEIGIWSVYGHRINAVYYITDFMSELIKHKQQSVNYMSIHRNIVQGHNGL